MTQCPRSSPVQARASECQAPMFAPHPAASCLDTAAAAPAVTTQHSGGPDAQKVHFDQLAVWMHWRCKLAVSARPHALVGGTA